MGGGTKSEARLHKSVTLLAVGERANRLYRYGKHAASQPNIWETEANLRKRRFLREKKTIGWGAGAKRAQLEGCLIASLAGTWLANAVKEKLSHKFTSKK